MSVPNKKTTSSERKLLQHQRWFRNGQKWRTGSEGFVLSGIGGALLNEYLSRAKPSVAITAVSFEGPIEQITTSEAMRELAESEFALPKYVSYSDLTERESQVSGRLQQMKDALDATASWLSRPENSNPSASPRASFQELQKSPFLMNTPVEDVLIAEFNASRLKTPPDNLAVVRRGSALGQLTRNENDFTLDFGSSSITVPLYSKDSDYLNSIQLLAESLLYGDRADVIYYLRTFSEIAGQRIRTLERLQAMFRDIIYSNARLRVSIFASNSGREIAIMKPVFGLLIDHEDFKKPFVLTTTSTVKKSTPSGDLAVASVLPESSSVPAFSIEPGKSTSLHLVGVDPLGQDARKISEIYMSGVLRCKVVAFTNSGASVESPTSVFGSRISPEDLNRVHRLHQ
jgi:hypothetical protein